MLITRQVHVDLFDDATKFQPTDHSEIFEKLDDGYFVAALEWVPEEGEGQYPMEDVLDKYRAHIEEFKVAEPEHPKGQVDVFSARRLERAVALVDDLLHRRAYNVTVTEGDKNYVQLKVDDSVGDAKV
ncbi:hypothetical protein ACQBAR_04070 [Propionibacteriaceae bacterium Y1685]